MIKRLLGYDIEPGISSQDYERWLWDTHVPDLFANPYLDQIVFNTVSGIVQGDTSFYRIAELHFSDSEAHTAFVDWRAAHPVDPDRSPVGKTAMRFYVLAESEVVRRP